MRTFITTLLMLAVLGPALAIDPQSFESPEEEARYQDLIEEIRCLVCQNQNLADSNAGLAKDLRDQVLELMRDGMSNDEIKTFLVERYGDFVLYRPPVKSSTYFLWFGPGLIVLAGGITLFFALRRRAVDDPEELADPDQEELDREIDELEKNNP